MYLGRPTLVIECNPKCPNGPFLGALGAPEAAVFASQHFQPPTPGRFGVTGPTVSHLACAWRVACGHMSREFKSNHQSSPGQQNAAQTGGTAAQLPTEMNPQVVHSIRTSNALSSSIAKLTVMEADCAIWFHRGSFSAPFFSRNFDDRFTGICDFRLNFDVSAVPI